MWPFSRSAGAAAQSWVVANGQVRSITTGDDWLDVIGVGTGADGLPHGDKARALAFPASAACLRLISNLVASVPVHVYSGAGTGNRKRVADHPAERLLNDFAQPWQPSSEFLRLMTLNAMYDGQAFAKVIRVRGQSRELAILPTGVSVELDPATSEPAYLVTRPTGQPERIRWRDMIHLSSPTGGAPIKQAAGAIELGLQLEQSALRLFRNGGRPAGILTINGHVDKKTAAEVRKAWQEDKDIPGGMPVLGADVKFTPMTMLSTDAEHIANRQQQVLEVSRVFGVPPTLLSHLQDATLANVEHLFRQLLTTCIDPWLDAWRGALTRCLLTDAERLSGVYLEHRTEDLTSADMKTTAEAFEKEVGGPVVTPNEARRAKNLPPVDGGDKLYPPRGAAAPAATPTA